MKVEDIQKLFEDQKSYFQSGATMSYEFRRKQLLALKDGLVKHEKILTDAVFKDFKKPAEEAYITEIGASIHEIDHALKYLKRWMHKKRVSTNLLNIPGRSYRIPHPLGSNLIIGAWNYPFFLVFGPLVGAIAAGNTAILKPSEMAPHSSKSIADLIASIFPPEYIAVVEGGVETSTELLKLPFDHLFFTGSTAVGKIIMKAGAEHLSKVTLELGGKSPAIVDEDAKIQDAAKKIVFGKGVNSGQTCIAPDYVYVHVDQKDALLSALKEQYAALYPEQKHLAEIVNEKHYERLQNIIQKETVYHQSDYPEDKENDIADSRFIPPTIVYPTNWNQPVMQEEIFGPILPVLTYENIDEVITTINQMPHPLALYYFGKKNHKKISRKIQFGGATINDTLLHIVNPHLPFGGVGDSGQGSYHGKSGFDCFSHFKSVLKKGTWIDFAFRYPPYTEKKMKWVKKIF